MDYRVITVAGKQHVLRKVNRSEYALRNGVAFKVPEPNYMGTGMALCAVLQHNETLVQWLAKNP